MRGALGKWHRSQIQQNDVRRMTVCLSLIRTCPHEDHPGQACPAPLDCGPLHPAPPTGSSTVDEGKQINNNRCVSQRSLRAAQWSLMAASSNADEREEFAESQNTGNTQRRGDGIARRRTRAGTIEVLNDDLDVSACSEFGWTPTINNNACRDHWPQVGDGLISQRGFFTGQVIDARDRLGAGITPRPASMSPKSMRG